MPAPDFPDSDSQGIAGILIIFRRLPTGTFRQSMQDSAAELTGGFFCESQGYDFLRGHAQHQQGDVTGSQLVGFSRSGRGRDKGTCGVINERVLIRFGHGIK